MNKLYLITMAMLCALSIQAQHSNEYLYKSFESDAGILNYRVLLPPDFDSDKKYPVVLVLHGAGERGDDNEKQLVHGSRLFKEKQESFPTIVVFPQCENDSYWANVEKTTVDGKVKREYGYGKEPTVAMKKLLAFTDYLLGLNYTDESRFYVGGLSMGGMGTFEILWRKPEVFAAAFAICGGGNPESIKKYNKELSLWVFHGGKDDVVIPENSEIMVEALRMNDMDVKFSLYPEANHNSWDSAFAEPELLPWLFSKHK